MTPDDRPWQVRVVQDAGRTRVRRRNRRAVSGWTAATLSMLFVALLTDLQAGPLWLTLGCYGAAGVCGVILLAYLFAKRLYVTAPQER